MTLDEYKAEIRKYRGHLKSCDDTLDNIYRNATKALRDWTLSSKAIGVYSIEKIAVDLSKDKQDEFVKWVVGNKKKHEIDTWLLENM